MLRGYHDASDSQHERTRHDSRSLVLGGDRFDRLPVSSSYRDRDRLDLSGLTALRRNFRIRVGYEQRRVTLDMRFELYSHPLHIISGFVHSSNR